MLKGISPLLSPDVLRALAQMGHADKILLADAFFPAEKYARKGIPVFRADGIGGKEMLDAVLALLPLDSSYTDTPVTLYSPPPEFKVETPIWEEYKKIVAKHDERGTSAVKAIPKKDFLAACDEAFAIVQTGETALFGLVMLEKGL